MEPFKNISDVQKSFQQSGHETTVRAIRRQAETGNLFCQILMWTTAGQNPQLIGSKDPAADFRHYVSLAAHAGDPASQFNLGKILLDLVDADSEYYSQDDLDNIAMAREWVAKAAAQGFEPAIEMHEDLKVFDE